ncbi:FAD-dependent oxidoreductase [Streptomyces sp. NBC_00083]|uniref:FAD-dependent oxidoreductase n=1 Tax=Streptomyces sp. NBC_00083 TaxID=2975647 RepID=UPI0022563CD3|nr:FAD-dependent oxidoreductase [Streptomyces sp. NBC_00083]MCX5384530.1 FAD-dependent oxidoreductase [Streptomyces sp. NBC_00083]
MPVPPEPAAPFDHASRTRDAPGQDDHPTSTGRPGRDARARLLPARPGTARPRDATSLSVGVVGGGIAGLAAATALAERGVRVTLYERADTLGGRLAGWPTTLSDGSRVTMSRGFHAFFRQYYNLRALLRRTDPALRRLTPLPDYPLRHADGLHDSFAAVPRTPPWSALSFAARSRSFPLRELARVHAGAALGLLDVRVPDIYARLDSLSAYDYLDSIRFPRSARHLAFEVFSRSFFADPRTLSAAEMALMFHIYFLGSAEGLLFDVPDEPFPQALWDPLADRLRLLGARVRTSTEIDGVTPDRRGGLRLATERGDDHHDACVLALNVPGLVQLTRNSPELGDPAWRARIEGLRTAPPFLVSRLWLDRPVARDRPGFLGTSGYGDLDNVSVLERWEGEAARWSARTGGSVVELHAYAQPEHADRRAVQDRLLGQLHRVFPETRGSAVVDARHEWRDDCPLFPVGGYEDRPTVRTPRPDVMLAGDTIRCDLPVALMERAATTGLLAANGLLAGWGIAGHDLWTVPARGRTLVTRRLAALAGG